MERWFRAIPSVLCILTFFPGDTHYLAIANELQNWTVRRRIKKKKKKKRKAVIFPVGSLCRQEEKPGQQQK